MRATFQKHFFTRNVTAFDQTRSDSAVSLVRWRVILVATALAVGSLWAAFLWSPEFATRPRFVDPWLLFLLPVGGFAIGLLYRSTDRNVEGSNNLTVEQLHEPWGRRAAAQDKSGLRRDRGDPSVRQPGRPRKSGGVVHDQ